MRVVLFYFVVVKIATDLKDIGIKCTFIHGNLSLGSCISL